MSLAAHVAALDIGGTKTAAALVDADGAVLARASVATPASQGAGAILDAAADLVASLGGAPVAVGVGSAGVVDPASGVVLSATDTLPGWAGTELAAGLAERLALPVGAVNDVHAHGIGEVRYGAGRGAGTVLSVAVGTGIGGALVVDGALYAGRHAAAGHVGHVPSRQAGELPCSCGAHGHLEGFASGPSLAREYERRTGTDVGDLRDVVALAQEGDGAAAALLAEGGTAVGEAVAGLVNVLDPDLVVVGGGVVGVGESWWTALLEAVLTGVLPVLSSTPVVRSGLGVDAALLGAAAVAWEKVR
ncbi:MAG: ROK family protein [Nocardioides sp.]|uniref:ROK family protein n=1 Tax=Nocardioides sp. TaxID=35761 RepID=UPI003F0F85BC